MTPPTHTLHKEPIFTFNKMAVALAFVAVSGIFCAHTTNAPCREKQPAAVPVHTFLAKMCD